MTRRRGLALIVVSWLVILLSLWGAMFLREATVAGASAGHAASRFRALMACESAVETLRAFLADEANHYSGGQAQPWADNASVFGKIPAGEGLFGALASYDLVAGELKHGLSDEASKLSLNLATKDMLLKLPGMTEEAAEAIVDWRDNDSKSTEKGAEDGFYGMLEKPYETKNQFFETLEELLYVRNVDPKLVYGEDWNLNGRLDAAENDGADHLPDDDRDGKLDPGLWRWLTLFSFEQNLSPAGKKRVNINDASQQDLQSALGDRLSGAQIQRLIQRRPYSTIGHLADVPQIGQQGLARVIDDITVDSAEVSYGKVNVVTAPREVLLALPGMTEELADKLVAYRSGREDGLDTLAWLLSEAGLAPFKSLAPYVTVRSWQFRFQAQGWVEGGTAYARRYYVIDTMDGKWRILHLRDLHRYGPLRLPSLEVK